MPQTTGPAGRSRIPDGGHGPQTRPGSADSGSDHGRGVTVGGPSHGGVVEALKPASFPRVATHNPGRPESDSDAARLGRQTVDSEAVPLSGGHGPDATAMMPEGGPPTQTHESD